MTRVEVVTYLAAVLDDLLVDTGIAATDTVAALKEPLDDALLAMGYADAEIATAAPTDGRWFRLMAEYHVLRRMLSKLALRFRLSTGGTALSLEQVHDHVKARLGEVAATLVAEYGGIGSGGAGGGGFSIQMPFLEQTAGEWAEITA